MARKEIGRVEVNPDHRPSELKKYDAELSEDELARRLTEIHQHLRDQEARLKVVATTRTPLGQELNWIERKSQVPGGKLPDPPSEDQPVRIQRRDDRELHPLRFELEHTGAEMGPPGTIPIVKRDLARIHPRGTLQDFLAKGSRAEAVPAMQAGTIAQPLAGGPHEYAYTNRSGTCYGSQGNINAWDPYTAHSDEFSLGQVALAATGEGGMQTVEAGHQECRDLYGDWVPHLFVFYTTNGYTSGGDNKGGYNRDVQGWWWVQYSSAIYPGALSSPLSSYGGTQYVMPVKYQLWQGNWWLRINGQWIGYYPARLFANPGLRDAATDCSWYGEIVDSASHADSTTTTMGSGEFPPAGWQYAAFMSNLEYQSDTNGAMGDYSPASCWASRPGCYDIDCQIAGGGSWGSYFWWGGPGQNPNCP